MAGEFEKYPLQHKTLLCTVKMYKGIISVGKGIKFIVNVKSNFKSVKLFI